MSNDDTDCDRCGWDGTEPGYLQIADRGDIRWIRCECNPEGRTR